MGAACLPQAPRSTAPQRCPRCTTLRKEAVSPGTHRCRTQRLRARLARRGPPAAGRRIPARLLRRASSATPVPPHAEAIADGQCRDHPLGIQSPRAVVFEHVGPRNGMAADAGPTAGPRRRSRSPRSAPPRRRADPSARTDRRIPVSAGRAALAGSPCCARSLSRSCASSAFSNDTCCSPCDAISIPALGDFAHLGGRQQRFAWPWRLHHSFSPPSRPASTNAVAVKPYR